MPRVKCFPALFSELDISVGLTGATVNMVVSKTIEVIETGFGAPLKGVWC